ncbi:MAG: hypothetical protein GXN96_01970 [Aquificae bacterium]|nr:hypothetical protein [Aquificota bacterium]
MSVKEEIKLTILSFAGGIENREPFTSELVQFRLTLKAQILKTLTLTNDADVRERLMGEVIEGVNEAITEVAKSLNYERENLMERQALFLESINEVMKEFLDSDELHDKHELSQLTSRIAKIIERLHLELKEKRGGILKRLRSLLLGG